jgi:hypothetical protein
MAEQLSFQIAEGGSIPTSPLQLTLQPCEWHNISFVFNKYHYKGNHMGGDLTLCFRLFYDGNVWGAAAFGPPRHNSKYSTGGSVVLDLRRLACPDAAPRNTESYFLGKMIWWIKKHKLADAILTFADLTQGHTGVIYKAANFKLVGETAPGKHIVWKGKQYHMRSLTIDRPYSKLLNEAVAKNEAAIIGGKPKLIYWYQITPKGEYILK